MGLCSCDGGIKGDVYFVVLFLVSSFGDRVSYFIYILNGLRQENVSSGICGEPRPRFAQADQGLRYPQTELLDTVEYFNGEQMPG